MMRTLALACLGTAAAQFDIIERPHPAGCASNWPGVMPTEMDMLCSEKCFDDSVQFMDDNIPAQYLNGHATVDLMHCVCDHVTNPHLLQMVGMSCIQGGYGEVEEVVAKMWGRSNGVPQPAASAGQAGWFVFGAAFAVAGMMVAQRMRSVKAEEGSPMV
jgi:hypothetical protein